MLRHLLKGAKETFRERPHSPKKALPSRNGDSTVPITPPASSGSATILRNNQGSLGLLDYSEPPSEPL